MEQELQYSAHRKSATLFNSLEGAKAFMVKSTAANKVFISIPNKACIEGS